MRTTILFATAALALVACGGTPGQRLNDAAIDMNTATRFGRLDIAMDHVVLADQEGFQKRHASWGHAVRVVDLEFAGMKLEKKDVATVYVTVVWQHSDDSSTLSTTIAQTWKDDTKSGWMITAEKEKEGDKGLLVDPSSKAKDQEKPATKPAPSQAQHYQTKVIYENEDDG